MNTFSFRPVGQGLFYTGSLLNGACQFVYDCGTVSKYNFVGESINDYIHSIPHAEDQLPHIDFITISHLHKDHFNGLYELVCKSRVDYIYLPYLGTERSFIEFVLAYSIFYNSANAEEDMERDDTLYRFMLSLYGIGDRVRHIRDIEVRFLREEGRSFSLPLNSGNAPYWQFHFITKELNPAALSSLQSDIASLLKNVPDIVSFIRSSRGNIEMIAKVYQDIFGRKNRYGLRGGLNISSTILVHFPLFSAKSYYLDKTYSHLYGLPYRKDTASHVRKYGRESARTVTVLTGDAMLDDRMRLQVEEAVRAGGSEPLVLQIPHHGAKENWKELKKSYLFSEVYVIPFGYGNSHGHPHTDTIDELLSKHLQYFYVTQDALFTYNIEPCICEDIPEGLPIRNHSRNEVEEKDFLNIAWSHFNAHANQRMQVFNFFLVVQTLLITALVTVFRLQFSLFPVRIILSISILFFSVVFMLIDIRTTHLIEIAEQTVRSVERKYMSRYSSEIMVFSMEKQTTECRNRKRINKIYSYTLLFRTIFIFFMLFGIVGIVLSFLL